MQAKKTLITAILFLMLLPGAGAQSLREKADIDGSGTIDANDLFLIREYWHQEISDSTDLVPVSFSEFYQEPSYQIVPEATPYDLPLDPGQILHWEKLQYFANIDSASPLLRENGFAVLPSSTGEYFLPWYYRLRSLEIPIFVTTDTLLHLYHVQFDDTLKEIEEREFYGGLISMTRALLAEAQLQAASYEGDLAEAARRNVAFFAVAARLLEPTAEIPSSVESLVGEELDLIDAHGGFVSSPIFVYEEDYSQYVPRGHYTRSETLERYFQAMMWYGRIGFLLRDSDILPSPNARIQTLGACLIADALERVQTAEGNGAGDLWNRIYSVTCFYVGFADDLLPSNYREAVREVLGVSADLSALTGSETFTALRAYLANLRSPKIYGGTGNCTIVPPFDPSQIDECLEKSKGMRLMGQRYVPDSYMFQNLVSADYLGSGAPFTLVLSGAGRLMRGFPRGLDAMDILGSARAYEILAAEGDTEYKQYPEQRRKLIEEFATLTTADWNRNLYWGWLYTLKALFGSRGSGYPTFMQTEAWTDRNLSTALASWTELRHDTILYAKQSYTPRETSVPDPVPGYVEPEPEFFARLLALARMTRTGLDELDALDDAARTRMMAFESVLETLLGIVVKQLNGEALENWEGDYILNIDMHLAPVQQGIEEQGVKTTLVADVHTEANTSQVLEEAVGYTDLLVVVLPQPDGRLVAAAGPVFSYYEFKWPQASRLTDEAWRSMLLKGDAPSRPPWTASFLGE